MKRKVQAWGIGSRVFTIDDEATKGATVGKNLYNEDGSLFVPAVAVTADSGTTPSYTSTLWRLILEIPQNVLDIVNGPWPTIRNSLLVSESFTIPAGRQMIVYGSFDCVGTLTAEGQLVIL